MIVFGFATGLLIAARGSECHKICELEYRSLSVKCWPGGRTSKIALLRKRNYHLDLARPWPLFPICKLAHISATSFLL
jgi:hypothetical protein